MYPGITALFDERMLSFPDPYGYGFQFHFAALQVSPVSIPSFGGNWYDRPTRWLHKYRKWVKQTDPTNILLSLTGLRSLRFVSYNYHSVHVWLFERGAVHPTHEVDWAILSQLQISFLNLIGIDGGRDLEVDAATACSEDNIPWKPNYVYIDTLPMDRPRWRNFFNGIKASGWKIEDTFYDNHFTYPVSDRQHCNDKEICGFMERVSDTGCGEWKILEATGMDG